MKKLLFVFAFSLLVACNNSKPQPKTEADDNDRYESLEAPPADTIAQKEIGEETPPPPPPTQRDQDDNPPPPPEHGRHGDNPPPPPPSHERGDNPPPKPDNMRGFDPASEDDMPDNGMDRYMENNDEEGWD